MNFQDYNEIIIFNFYLNLYKKEIEFNIKCLSILDLNIPLEIIKFINILFINCYIKHFNIHFNMYTINRYFDKENFIIENGKLYVNNKNSLDYEIFNFKYYVFSIYSTDMFSIILTSNGLYAKGSNKNHNFGHSFDYCGNFKELPFRNVLNFSCSSSHSIIIFRFSGLLSCGNNCYGQLGLGDYDNRKRFSKIQMNNILSISCGNLFSMIIDKYGILYGCGANNNKQLSLDINNIQDINVFIQIYENVYSVSCGNMNTIILTKNGLYKTTPGFGFQKLNLNYENIKMIDSIDDSQFILYNNGKLEILGECKRYFFDFDLDDILNENVKSFSFISTFYESKLIIQNNEGYFLIKRLKDTNTGKEIITKEKLNLINKSM